MMRASGQRPHSIYPRPKGSEVAPVSLSPNQRDSWTAARRSASVEGAQMGRVSCAGGRWVYSAESLNAATWSADLPSLSEPRTGADTSAGRALVCAPRGALEPSGEVVTHRACRQIQYASRRRLCGPSVRQASYTVPSAARDGAAPPGNGMDVQQPDPQRPGAHGPGVDADRAQGPGRVCGMEDRTVAAWFAMQASTPLTGPGTPRRRCESRYPATPAVSATPANSRSLARVSASVE